MSNLKNNNEIAANILVSEFIRYFWGVFSEKGSAEFNSVLSNFGNGTRICNLNDHDYFYRSEQERVFLLKYIKYIIKYFK